MLLKQTEVCHHLRNSDKFVASKLLYLAPPKHLSLAQ